MRLVSLLAVLVAGLFALVDPAAAQEGMEAAASSGLNAQGLAALGISFAVMGGAWGQSKVVQAALESIGRNPGAAGQMFLPWLLALVFIESLVIYALLIALKIVGII